MTRDRWFEVVDALFQPRRPDLARCIAERDAHVARRQAFAEARTKEIQENIARIERARAAVFEAKDGVVPAEMTRLEREWKALSRRDPDEALMDLWARLVPRAWHDKKVWRDGKGVRIDVAVGVAADLEGVERAEAAATAFAQACTAWGTPIGTDVRFAAFAEDARPVTKLLVPLLSVDREMARRVRALERALQEKVRLRFPHRAGLARDIAIAAAFDTATASDRRPNPARALRDLWRTGYGLVAADPTSVTVEIPPLPSDS